MRTDSNGPIVLLLQHQIPSSFQNKIFRNSSIYRKIHQKAAVEDEVKAEETIDKKEESSLFLEEGKNCLKTNMYSELWHMVDML